MINNLDLDYEKIDACPNDCMLFRNDQNDDEFCHTCGALRYIKSPEVDTKLEPSKKQTLSFSKDFETLSINSYTQKGYLCAQRRQIL